MKSELQKACLPSLGEVMSQSELITLFLSFGLIISESEKLFEEEESKTVDRSHIVGHINSDGSIRPVVPPSTSGQELPVTAVSPISGSGHIRQEELQQEAKNVIVEQIVS